MVWQCFYSTYLRFGTYNSTTKNTTKTETGHARFQPKSISYLFFLKSEL